LYSLRVFIPRSVANGDTTFYACGNLQRN
jgi:hypothetical protein